jgi:transposase
MRAAREVTSRSGWWPAATERATCPRRRRRGSASSPVAGAARPTSAAAENRTTVLALPDERNLTGHRIRLASQLHALLRDLIPGGAPADLTAAAASRLLSAVRPSGLAETARRQLARDITSEIRDSDQRLKRSPRR